MLYESFRYIYSPSHDHFECDVLEKKYNSFEDLGKRFVIFSENIGYRVFPDREKCLNWLETLAPCDRTFHEVIFSRAQKLKFDIDSPAERLTGFHIPLGADDYSATASMESKYAHVFGVIRDTLREAFFITYGTDLSPENEIICESHCAQGSKFSNHIVITGYYVEDNKQATEFTRRLLTLLPALYRPFLDAGVNKTLQNFRLVGCRKEGSERVKKIVSQHSQVASLICNVDGCELLPSIIDKAKQVDSVNLHTDDVDKIMEICKKDGEFANHRLKSVQKNIITWTRVSSSHCNFCNRVHVADNNMIVSINLDNGVLSVFKQCRKYLKEHEKDGSHRIKLGEILAVACEKPTAATMENVTSWTDKTIIRCIEELSKSDPVPRTAFDRLGPGAVNTYCADKLAPFELCKTLVVRAAMKMGKTKALMEYIDTHFSSQLRKPVIRFISFRQTFSGNIKEKFPDFVLYSDVKGPISAHRVIIQVESLHRLDVQRGDEPPDLLILDECESIFEQFDSGLLRENFNDCFAKFQYLMKFSKHVVCMDANVSDRTFNVLHRMRPQFAEAIGCGETVYHYNKHKNGADDKYFVTGDKLKWLGLLYSCADSDERISVPMSSLAEAKILERNLRRRYPTKNIMLYSSETKNSEKKEHFADVNTYWAQLDILIYTPTVSAGVSFEQKHFNTVFGYFTDQSCNVEVCQQMIGRIRDVAGHTLYLCLAASGNNLPTSTEEIKNMLYTKRDMLGARFDDHGLTVEYLGDGEKVYHTNDYFYLWLENMRIRNISRNIFIKHFINILAANGAEVNILSQEVFEAHTGTLMMPDNQLSDELCAIQDDHRTARVEIRGEVCVKIVSAAEITDETADEIREAMMAQQDIDEDRKYAFEKYRLRKDYNYSHTIDVKFVEKYHEPKIRRMYKNITRISACDDTSKALEKIKSEELAVYKFLMESEKTQNQDLKRMYVFDQHRYALGFLSLCGWTGINDRQYHHSIILGQNITAQIGVYWASIRNACNEFGIKTPSLRFANTLEGLDRVTYLLKPINRILYTMYGVNICAKKKDPHMFYLSENKMFTTCARISQSKGVPIIITDKYVEAVFLNVPGETGGFITGAELDSPGEAPDNPVSAGIELLDI